MFKPLFEGEDAIIAKATLGQTTATTTVTKLTTEIAAIKAALDTDLITWEKSCQYQRFEGANLFYSCVQAAIDNYAKDHYGSGHASWDRWTKGYLKCRTSLAMVGTKDYHEASINKPCADQ